MESWVDEGLETRENALCWTNVDAMMGLYYMYIARRGSMSLLASRIHSLPSRFSEDNKKYACDISLVDYCVLVANLAYHSSRIYK